MNLQDAYMAFQRNLFDQIMTPESFQRLSDAFDEELHLEQTGTADPDRVRIMELEEYKKDGFTIWVENTASFIRNNDQKPVSILVVSRDITERKQAEIALRNSEQKWRNILINRPQIGIALDPQAKITFVNAHFLKLTGWTEQEIIFRGY